MTERTSGALRRAAGGTVRLLIGRPLASRRAHEEEFGSIEGLPALSLDPLTSVAYEPEAIVVVLAAGGAAALRLTLPIELVIVALLALLVASYRQVIAGYPHARRVGDDWGHGLQSVLHGPFGGEVGRWLG